MRFRPAGLGAGGQGQPDHHRQSTSWCRFCDQLSAHCFGESFRDGQPQSYAQAFRCVFQPLERLKHGDHVRRWHALAVVHDPQFPAGAPVD